MDELKEGLFMKKIVLFIIVLVTAVFATDYYDEHGHRTGRSLTNGTQTNYYDEHGHRTGR